MKIVAYAWYNGRNVVGIVVYQNEVGEFYAAIGPGLGEDQTEDVRYIAECGNKHFPIKAAVIVIDTQGTIKDPDLYQGLKNFLNPVITKEEILEGAQLLGLVLEEEDLIKVKEAYTIEYQKDPALHKRLILEKALESLTQNKF